MIVPEIVSAAVEMVPLRLPSVMAYGNPVRQNILPENCQPSVSHFNRASLMERRIDDEVGVEQVTDVVVRVAVVISCGDCADRSGPGWNPQ